MDTVSVYWLSYHDDALARGYWDNGLLEDIFQRGSFNHIEIKNTEFPDVEKDAGGVVVINGRMHAEDVDKLNRDILHMRWVVIIITGDEEADFPHEDVRHPLLRKWVMMPRMNRHNDVSFKMPNGYRTGTHEKLKKMGRRKRDLDFSFIGQVNHARREQCRDAAIELEATHPSKLVFTDGFGKEAISHYEYMRTMAQSKIVLCPSGIETPDSFRLYEALEAGCIPVVDAFATKNQDWGFWNYLFGEQPPFPVIPYWDELPNLLPQLLKEYPDNANKIFAWWQLFKRNMYLKLVDDIKEVSA